MNLMQRILANPIVQNVGKLIEEAAVSLLDQPIEEILQDRRIYSANERNGDTTLKTPPQRPVPKGLVEWDAAIVKASRNEDYAKLNVCGQILSESSEDLSCFHMLACNVLAQKLGHQLSKSERNEVFQCAQQMFSNPKVGTRKKLIAWIFMSATKLRSKFTHFKINRWRKKEVKTSMQFIIRAKSDGRTNDHFR